MQMKPILLSLLFCLPVFGLSGAAHAEQTSWDKAKESATEAWESAKEAGDSAWDATKEKSSELLEGAQEGGDSLWESTKEKSVDIWDKTKEKSGELAEEAKKKADEVLTPEETEPAPVKPLEAEPESVFNQEA
ncbi:hypothetical protein [Enterovibrio norvegicus]|uniref:hypothetical protein n=1 Tax=Enterovibrio norvegicus TaxID=188144 RepID=UPI00352BF738